MPFGSERQQPRRRDRKRITLTDHPGLTHDEAIVDGESEVGEEADLERAELPEAVEKRLEQHGEHDDPRAAKPVRTIIVGRMQPRCQR